jgi:uncharacterized protein YcbX
LAAAAPTYSQTRDLVFDLLWRAGERSHVASMRSAAGRLAIEAFMRRFMAKELRGAPKVLAGNGHSFSDVARKVVSVINLASVAAIEAAVGAPVDPLRFRANVYLSGWPAWHEFELMENSLAFGAQARLKPVKRITRCAATNVDPATGARDLNIPKTLMQTFGHADCGIYCEVMTPGEIAIGDTIRAV